MDDDKSEDLLKKNSDSSFAAGGTTSYGNKESMLWSRFVEITLRSLHESWTSRSAQQPIGLMRVDSWI